VLPLAGQAAADHLHAQPAQPASVDGHGRPELGPVAADDHRVDQARADVVEEAADVVGGPVAVRLAGLLEQVAHVDARHARLPHRIGNAGNEQRRKRARKEAARPHDDRLGAGDGLEGAWMRGGVGRIEADVLALGAVGGERRLAAHLAAVPEPGDELDHVDGAGHHVSGDGQHAGRLGHRPVEASEHICQPGQEQVAEAVPRQLPGREPVLEELPDERLVLGQRDQAAAQVARRRHREVAAQAAARPAVIGDGNDGGKISNQRGLGGDRQQSGRVGNALLQTTQQGREAGSSAEGDDAHSGRRNGFGIGCCSHSSAMSLNREAGEGISPFPGKAIL
jgi:hypothetical protein